ncbi:hypothetical protein ACFL2D_01075 [Patescibacteria group bacterium]
MLRNQNRKVIIVSVIVLVLLLGVAGYFGYLYFADKTEASDVEQARKNLPPNEDTDSDQLVNSEEDFYETDPFDPDTDNDGYSDGEEVQGGFNPLGAGMLNIKGGGPIGQFSGTSLDEVFSSGGSYICNISINQQDLPMKIILKVKGDKKRQELVPNFENVSNESLDTVVLIRSGDGLFLGNGRNEDGWVKLVYNSESQAWQARGITISGGVFESPEAVLNSEPEKVECSPADIEESEFIIPPKYVIEPTTTYEDYQNKLKQN